MKKIKQVLLTIKQQVSQTCYRNMNNESIPGINHIEFWVSDIKKAIPFYQSFLTIIGWKSLCPVSFTNGSIEIFFSERSENRKLDSLGIRHLCFQATTSEQVDRVYRILLDMETTFIRKPQIMNYSKAYYTVDFYDPDGQIIEVAHTPYMEFQ